MSASPRPSHLRNASSPSARDDPPTFAAFSPPSAIHSPSVTGTQRSTILVQQKSPLLVATPPQITRALAYSHPFLLPLNRLVGLLTWTTGDPWESFLLVAAFWAVTLYGDLVTRWAGPLFVVMALILAMYARRYSPLSSTGWTGEKKKGHVRGQSADLNTAHHKSLDDIVETLRLFTSRCNILLDPFLRLTEFLSTQTTATSATTRPALTALFIRIVIVTPIWILLTLRPLYIITTKRVVLAVGTTILTWHSQPARVTRTIFWRSKTVRKLCATITGLDISGDKGEPSTPGQLQKGKYKSPHEIAASLAVKRGFDSAGIRFTFTLYENQRRWLGIGWTSSMLAYERGSWTDEHLNGTPPKERFELPEVEGGHAKWKWVEGSEWHLEEHEGLTPTKDSPGGDDGWIYYDNKWRDGRRGKDGWGRYTRRRKWCRDAELVEMDMEELGQSEATLAPRRDEDASTTTTLVDRPHEEVGSGDIGLSTAKDDADAASSTRRKKRWFGNRRPSQVVSEKSVALSSASSRSRDDEDQDYHIPFKIKEIDRSTSWGVGDDAEMSFG